jgi:hypothetical protein
MTLSSFEVAKLDALIPPGETAGDRYNRDNLNLIDR